MIQLLFFLFLLFFVRGTSLFNSTNFLWWSFIRLKLESSGNFLISSKFLSYAILYFVLYINLLLWLFVLFLEALLVALNLFISSSFLSLIFSNLLNNPSFLSSSLNPLLNILPNGEYSNFACSIVLGFKPKSSPVNN